MGTLVSQKRTALRRGTFAFPNERKAPIEDASHVRSAIARFGQVNGVSSAERVAAWNRILAAAGKSGVEVGAKGRPRGRSR